MKYVRTKNGKILKVFHENVPLLKENDGLTYYGKNTIDFETSCWLPKDEVIKQADTIEELCDCFVKIKRKKGCQDYILKFDFKDLPLLREQHLKYKGTSPIYGAIHIEDKGLIYVAKMNEKGELELL